MRQRIDSHSKDAGPSVRPRASEHPIRFPIETKRRTGRGDPDLVSSSTESNSSHPAVENALDADG
jgi:hypothetical protein